MIEPTRFSGAVACGAGGPTTAPTFSCERLRPGIVAAGARPSGSVVSIPSPVPSSFGRTGSAIRPPTPRILRVRSGLQDDQKRLPTVTRMVGRPRSVGSLGFERQASLEHL